MTKAAIPARFSEALSLCHSRILNLCEPQVHVTGVRASRIASVEAELCGATSTKLRLQSVILHRLALAPSSKPTRGDPRWPSQSPVWFIWITSPARRVGHKAPWKTAPQLAKRLIDRNNSGDGAGHIAAIGEKW
jgi:hypothetical protein